MYEMLCHGPPLRFASLVSCSSANCGSNNAPASRSSPETLSWTWRKLTAVAIADKCAQSRTKEVYLSRAVEVQPCFNRDVISDLSDQATTNLLELSALTDGVDISEAEASARRTSSVASASDSSIETDVLRAISSGNEAAIQRWIDRVQSSPDAGLLVSQAFFAALDDAPDAILDMLLATHAVNFGWTDELNGRNILHRSALTGRSHLLRLGLDAGVDSRVRDVYGRIPLHYASMHGFEDIIRQLVQAKPDSIDTRDHDNFTPLIHGIVQSQLGSVETLLQCGAQVDQTSSSDHIPLNFACQFSQVCVIDALLKRNPQILPDAEGLYPQHLVARAGRPPELLLMLQDFGADLNQADKLYSWTPLFHAASEGNLECLRVLLQRNCLTDVVDEKGLSALYYAAWEGNLDCIRLLGPLHKTRPPRATIQSTLGKLPSTSTISPAPMSIEPEGIPPISLPPPIIPVRRYGHNFLDHKTFVALTFQKNELDPIQFYDDNKYPAARLTISSRSSDLIPQNMVLPFQDESRTISFQIDDLSNFSIEFEIYPTFGAKVIARTVASSRVFTGRASRSGHWHLELFDSRSRAIGRISFNFQVITPYVGAPLEITHFATYWKATSQLDSHPSALITGSSLSGDYVRLYVQVTADGVPVLYPNKKVAHHGLDLPVTWLTFEDFKRIGADQGSEAVFRALGKASAEQDTTRLYQIAAGSFASLKEVLQLLPGNVHVEVHVIYPANWDDERIHLGRLLNINDFADAILTTVFDHARHLRESSDGFVRSVVFSSFNPDMCTALNWKQPNYPVLLCNRLGADRASTTSVKDAVQIASANNFMGLIASAKLLELAPPLIDAIKTAGLVLVTDNSEEGQDSAGLLSTARMSGWQGVPEGVDGILRGNGVLRFHDSIDM